MGGRPARGIAKRVMSEVRPISPTDGVSPRGRPEGAHFKAAAQKLGKSRFHPIFGPEGGGLGSEMTAADDPGIGRGRGAAERRRAASGKPAGLRRAKEARIYGDLNFRREALDNVRRCRTVRRLAHLAAIDGFEDEVPKYAGELNAMMAFVEQYR